jgi:hypothetical protein
MHIRRHPAAPFGVMQLACIPPRCRIAGLADSPFLDAAQVHQRQSLSAAHLGMHQQSSQGRNMTAFGRYARDTTDMFNIELARIIQTEREQEIQAELRRRRLLGGNNETAVRDESAPPAPRLQRRASGATSR